MQLMNEKKSNFTCYFHISMFAIDFKLCLYQLMRISGVVINTASVAAFDGQIGQAAYSGMTLPATLFFKKLLGRDILSSSKYYRYDIFEV